MFNIEFFTTISGRSPVEDYIDNQPSKVATKIYRTIKLLETYGLKLPGKHLKKMAGTADLWELRVKSGAQQHRMFLAKVGNTLILLLHAVSKKRRKTATKDTATALERLRQYK